MTDLTELAQRTDSLMDNALETAKQLRELSASSVAEAIFESIVENENGKEIQLERPISDLAYAAFLQLERLVEALEKAQRYITELDREHQTFRIVGVRSVKASLRVENSKSRFIELWLRPGIFLPHKRPEHSMSYYAGMAVLTGTKAEIY